MLRRVAAWTLPHVKQARPPPPHTARMTVPDSLMASRARVQALQHRLGDAGLIETALSWLLLTPGRVYKLRKPVQLGFARLP